MPSTDKPTPENCPEPFWHDTHRYCPACTWTEPQEEPRHSPLHQAMLDAGWTDRQIGAAMDAAGAEATPTPSKVTVYFHGGPIREALSGEPDPRSANDYDECTYQHADDQHYVWTGEPWVLGCNFNGCACRIKVEAKS